MKVLVALDDSEHSQTALTSVISRGFPKGSTFRILHVLEPFNPTEPSAVASTEDWSNWVSCVRTERQAHALKLVTEAATKIEMKFSDSEVVTDVREGHNRTGTLTRVELPYLVALCRRICRSLCCNHGGRVFVKE